MPHAPLPSSESAMPGSCATSTGQGHARIVLLCLVATCLPLSSHAGVWKCSIDGRVHYSDQPCKTDTSARQLAPRVLQGNVIEVGRQAASATARMLPPAHVMPDEPAFAPGPPASVCPSERDLASMETTASSNSLSPEAKRFVQDEIRRARQCQKGQGRYSAADWAISRDAVAAQSSLTGAADARIRSESMHSAADPAEGERIARRQELELRTPLRIRQRLTPMPELASPASAPSRASCVAGLSCP